MNICGQRCWNHCLTITVCFPSGSQWSQQPVIGRLLKPNISEHTTLSYICTQWDCNNFNLCLQTYFDAVYALKKYNVKIDLLGQASVLNLKVLWNVTFQHVSYYRLVYISDTLKHAIYSDTLKHCHRNPTKRLTCHVTESHSNTMHKHWVWKFILPGDDLHRAALLQIHFKVQYIGL